MVRYPLWVLSFIQAHLCDTHFATYRAIIVRYPIKTSTKEFCDTIIASIARYEKYRCWASKLGSPNSIAAGPLSLSPLYSGPCFALWTKGPMQPTSHKRSETRASLVMWTMTAQMIQRSHQCRTACALQVLLSMHVVLFRKLEKAGTVDFKKHPARKVGKRSRQCRPKVPGRFAFPGAPNPRIYSISRSQKNFPAIFPELSCSFPCEPPNHSRKQPQTSRVF